MNTNMNRRIKSMRRKPRSDYGGQTIPLGRYSGVCNITELFLSPDKKSVDGASYRNDRGEGFILTAEEYFDLGRPESIEISTMTWRHREPEKVEKIPKAEKLQQSKS